MMERNLLINTIVAMKKNNMGVGELANIIGVESRMLSSWINGVIKLDELSTYKLTWFVFLALVQGLSAKQIVERYNLSSLTLDKDPLDGREHLEPWNSVEYVTESSGCESGFERYQKDYYKDLYTHESDTNSRECFDKDKRGLFAVCTYHALDKLFSEVATYEEQVNCYFGPATGMRVDKRYYKIDTIRIDDGCMDIYYNGDVNPVTIYDDGSFKIAPIIEGSSDNALDFVIISSNIPYMLSIEYAS